VAGHLENNTIKNSQHVFMKGKLCLTNVFKLFEDVTSREDEGKPIDIAG